MKKVILSISIFVFLFLPVLCLGYTMTGNPPAGTSGVAVGEKTFTLTLDNLTGFCTDYGGAWNFRLGIYEGGSSYFYGSSGEPMATLSQSIILKYGDIPDTAGVGKLTYFCGGEGGGASNTFYPEPRWKISKPPILQAGNVDNFFDFFRDIFIDLWIVIAVMGGIPLAFYIINRTIMLVDKKR